MNTKYQFTVSIFAMKSYFAKNNFSQYWQKKQNKKKTAFFFTANEEIGDSLLRLQQAGANNQLLQLCTARTAWTGSDQAVRTVHSW